MNVEMDTLFSFKIREMLIRLTRGCWSKLTLEFVWIIMSCCFEHGWVEDNYTHLFNCHPRFSFPQSEGS